MDWARGKPILSAAGPAPRMFVAPKGAVDVGRGAGLQHNQAQPKSLGGLLDRRQLCDRVRNILVDQEADDFGSGNEIMQKRELLRG